MKPSFSLLFLVFTISSLLAQKGSFSVTVDKDTIFQDEVIQIEFLLDNLEGKFVAPDFKSFNIASGPNTSSSFTIINGEVSQKKSYSYILLPETSGNVVITPASVETESGVLVSDSIEVYVVESSKKYRPSRSQKRIFRYDSESNASSDRKISPKKRVLKKI